MDLEAHTYAVRAALKVELVEFFGGHDHFQELLRQELFHAMENWPARATPEGEVTGSRPVDNPDPTTSYVLSTSRSVFPRPERQLPSSNADEPASDQEYSSSGPPRPPTGLEATIDGVQKKQSLGNSAPSGSHWRGTESSYQSVSSDGIACQHFRTVAMASYSSHLEEDRSEPRPPMVRHRSSFLSNISSRLSSVLDQEAPARKGPLSSVLSSQAFDFSMRAVLLVNCAFLVYAANEDIRAWDSSPRLAVTVGELVFPVVYLVEMMAKLSVYRISYFFDKSNCFDCLLVCFDVWDLATKWVAREAFSAGYLRVFRLLKLGKALRAVQMVRAFEKLQAFLVCISGSLSSLGWSLVMLGIILYMFSLCIVQIIALHFRDSGDLLDDEGRSSFETQFGSVQMSMLTLFQLTTDGSGWKQSYDLITQTGWVGSIVFLAFVSFTHIAVINIITGIFVESAMQNLTPDRDSLALDHHFKEQQAAQELEQLFRRSCGGAGSVSQGDFDSLVKAGRLPRLLSLLGLRVQHAHDFFKFLSSASPDGEVPIASFVRGCMKLKGSATSFDLHLLQVDVQTIARLLKDLRRRTNAQNARLDVLSAGSQTQVQTHQI